MSQLQVVGTVTECANHVTNSRCKCNCRNPHNDGWRCEQQNETGDSATDDEEQAPERLPLVTRCVETIDSNTESDQEVPSCTS